MRIQSKGRSLQWRRNVTLDEIATTLVSIVPLNAKNRRTQAAIDRL